MASPLSLEQIEQLRQFNTPTISNAVETFDIRPRTAGFMSPEIKCMFPEKGRLIGYAATSCIRASHPQTEDAPQLRREYWRHVWETPKPSIAVTQDLDDPPMQGAPFGDINTDIHMALGAVGHITNGSVRDLDEVREMAFQFFAPGPSVSHAYVHLVAYGTPVEIGGLTVYPGDLLHGDEHGVCLIPLEIADRVADAARQVLEREQPIHELCTSPDFTIDKLAEIVSGSGSK